jgi:hypothetical protein
MRSADFTTGVPVFLVRILAAVISEYSTRQPQWHAVDERLRLSNVCIHHDPKSQVQPYSAYDTWWLKRHNKAVFAKKNRLLDELHAWDNEAYKRSRIVWKSICSLTINDLGLSSVPVMYFTLEKTRDHGVKLHTDQYAQWILLSYIYGPTIVYLTFIRLSLMQTMFEIRK